MWPSTPATLQYSLTMAPSWRSLKRDTTARIRASSRAFSATKERSTTTRLTTGTAASASAISHLEDQDRFPIWECPPHCWVGTLHESAKRPTSFVQVEDVAQFACESFG